MKQLEKTDQYMMGRSILVAPLFTGQSAREVVLPRGNWYDFYSGKLAGNGETITIEADLGKIPLFVKEGGIIPMMPPVNNLATQAGNIPLEVRHYGKRAGMYPLYDDDGETFDYENGNFSITNLRVRLTGNRLEGSQDQPKDTWNSRYSNFTWKFMTP